MTIRILLTGLSLCSAALARDAAPADRPQPAVMGQVYDPREPAAVPQFLAQRAVPGGLADREGAVRFTLPTFGCFGFGYCGFGYGGFSYGGGYGFGGNWAPGTSIEGGGSLP